MSKHNRRYNPHFNNYKGIAPLRRHWHTNRLWYSNPRHLARAERIEEEM